MLTASGATVPGGFFDTSTVATSLGSSASTPAGNGACYADRTVSPSRAAIQVQASAILTVPNEPESARAINSARLVEPIIACLLGAARP